MDIKINENSVIVFDLDDTLYNELDFLKSAYIEIAKYLESSNWESLYAFMFSTYRSGNNVFDYLSKAYNRDIMSLIEMYRNHIPNIKLFDDVLDIINAIKEKKGKICIITDGRVKTQTAKLKALGIEDILDKVIISEAIGTEKPNSANFKIIENTFPNSVYYYIADNLKKDFVTPNSRSWKTLGLVDNGLNIHNNTSKHFLVQYKPQNFIISYKDITII